MVESLRVRWSRILKTKKEKRGQEEDIVGHRYEFSVYSDTHAEKLARAGIT